MNVGPNYRLGNILKMEGGLSGPVGGPLNPHIGPYYGLHGHRFHSSEQADSLLSGQSGPSEPSLILSTAPKQQQSGSTFGEFKYNC